MPVLSGIELLAHLGSTQLAASHFDVGGGNLDMAWSVCETLADLGCVAFLAGTPVSINSYLGYRQFVETITSAASHFGVRVAAHLDHATRSEDVRAALEAGFTSVMFDGSRLPFVENVCATQVVVKMSRAFGASVEGELGPIGGKDDEVRDAAGSLPSADECIRFVKETGVDLFAPAIGTRHGFYKKPVVLDMVLAQKLGRDLPVPLVLHGATGLNAESLRALIGCGFRKINYATGIRFAFRQGIAEAIDCNGDVTKPQTFLAVGRARVAQFVREQLSHLSRVTT